MIRIRPAVVSDADALARVMIEANQHAFRGLVPDRCLAWITPQESADNWRKTLGPGGMRHADCLLVAETLPEATVVGFAMGRPAVDVRLRVAKPVAPP